MRAFAVAREPSKMSDSLLQRLLHQYDFLAFDIEEHLLAVKHAEHLRQRFGSYVKAMHADGPWPLEKKILEYINAGRLDHIPHFARLRRPCERFEDLPLIQKADIRKHPDDYLSLALRPGHSAWTRKSYGTTSRPIQVVHSNEYYFDLLYLPIRKAAARFGCAQDDGSPVYALGIGEGDNFVLVDPTGETGLYVEVGITAEGSASRRRAIDMIYDLQPRFVSSRPNLFSLLMDDVGVQFDLERYRPEAVMSGGEALLPDMRSRLEGFFGCGVIDRYGMSEVGLIASECSRGYLHVDNSAHYVEVVTASREQAAEEEVGEIVVSGVGNRTMPFVRYRTGDVGALSLQPCRCGHRAPRLVRFTGRQLPNFVSPSGRSFSPFGVTSLVFGNFAEIKEFQLIQESPTALVLLVEFADGSRDHDAHMESLLRDIRSTLPLESMDLRCTTARFTKGHKFERFRSNVAP
jgi:phenylacetate-CoA ligase